jgi:YD repeat-containing protein
MKRFISGAACIILLAACSKSNTVKPPEETPDVLKYLTKVTDDDGGITELTYNAQNHLVSFIGDDNEGMRTSYGNDGNLLMSEVWTEDVLSRLYIDYVNGIPKTGVERYFLRADNSHTDTYNLEYTVENNQVVKIRMHDSARLKPSFDVFIRYEKGNITSALQVPVGEMTDTITYVGWTYGTKRNPYSALKSKYYVSPTGAGVLFQSANEPLTLHSRIPVVNATVREKFVYQYDKEGYPIREARVDEGATDSIIIHYEYRR